MQTAMVVAGLLGLVQFIAILVMANTLGQIKRLLQDIKQDGRERQG